MAKLGQTLLMRHKIELEKNRKTTLASIFGVQILKMCPLKLGSGVFIECDLIMFLTSSLKFVLKLDQYHLYQYQTVPVFFSTFKFQVVFHRFINQLIINKIISVMWRTNVKFQCLKRRNVLSSQVLKRKKRYCL